MSDDNRTASIIFKLAIEDSTLSAGVKAALAELSKFSKANTKEKTEDELKAIQTAKEAKKKADKEANTDHIQNITNALQQGTQALNTFYRALKLIATDNAFIQASSQYEVHLRNFNSLAQQTEAELQKTHLALKGLATEEQLAGMTELAKSLQHIESSNYHGAEAMMILESSNRAAMAGLADLFKVVDAGTSILKAYSFEASKIGEINNINAKIVQYGKISMDQLNSVIGTAISLAPEAGVKYEEIAAAISTITAQGVNAAIATTEVNALMKGIFKPSEQGKALAASIGLELSSSNLAAKGLGGMMKEIMDKTKQFGKDQSSVIATLLGDIREIRGLLKLATNDGKLYDEMLGHMTSSVDQVSLALKEQTKTWSYQQKALGDMTEVLKTEFGFILQKVFTPFITQLNMIIHLFVDLPAPIKAVVEGIILIGTGIVTVGIAIGGLSFALNTMVGALSLSATAAGTLRTALLGLSSVGLAMVMAGGFFYLLHLAADATNIKFLKTVDLMGQMQDYLDRKKLAGVIDENQGNVDTDKQGVLKGLSLRGKKKRTIEEDNQFITALRNAANNVQMPVSKEVFDAKKQAVSDEYNAKKGGLDQIAVHAAAVAALKEIDEKGYVDKNTAEGKQIFLEAQRNKDKLNNEANLLQKKLELRKEHEAKQAFITKEAKDKENARIKEFEENYKKNQKFIFDANNTARKTAERDANVELDAIKEGAVAYLKQKTGVDPLTNKKVGEPSLPKDRDAVREQEATDLLVSIEITRRNKLAEIKKQFDDKDKKDKEKLDNDYKQRIDKEYSLLVKAKNNELNLLDTTGLRKVEILGQENSVLKELKQLYLDKAGKFTPGGINNKESLEAAAEIQTKITKNEREAMKQMSIDKLDIINRELTAKRTALDTEFHTEKITAEGITKEKIKINLDEISKLTALNESTANMEFDWYKTNSERIKSLTNENVNLLHDEDKIRRGVEDNNIQYIENRRIKSEENIRAAKQKTSDIIKAIYNEQEAIELKHANIFEKIATKQTEHDSFNIPNPSGTGTFVPKVDIPKQIKSAEELKDLYKELGSNVIDFVNMVGSSISKVNKDLGDLITGFSSIIKSALSDPTGLSAIMAAFSFVADKIVEAINFDKIELGKFQDAYYNLNKQRIQSAGQTTAKLMELAELDYKHNMDVIERNSFGNNQYRVEQITEEERFSNEKLKIQNEAADKELQIQTDVENALMGIRKDSYENKKKQITDITNLALEKGRQLIAMGDVLGGMFAIGLALSNDKTQNDSLDLEHKKDLQDSIYAFEKSKVDMQSDSLAKTKALIDLETNYRLQALYDEQKTAGYSTEVYNQKYRTIVNEQNAKLYDLNKNSSTKIQEFNEKQYNAEYQLIQDTLGKERKELESNYEKQLEIIKDYDKKVKALGDDRETDKTEKKRQAGLLTADKARIKPTLGAGFFRDNQLSFDIKDEEAKNKTQDAYNSGDITLQQQIDQSREQTTKRILYLEYQRSINVNSKAAVKLDIEKKITAAKLEYSNLVDKDMLALEREKAKAIIKRDEEKVLLDAKRAEEEKHILDLEVRYKDSAGIWKTVMIDASQNWIDYTKKGIAELGSDIYHQMRKQMTELQQLRDEINKTPGTGGTPSGTTTGTPKSVGYTDAEINAMKKADALAQGGGSSAPIGNSANLSWQDLLNNGQGAPLQNQPLPPAGVPTPTQGNSLSFSGTGVTPTNIPNQDIIDRAPLMNLIQAAMGSTTLAGKMSTSELMAYMHQLGIKGYASGGALVGENGPEIILNRKQAGGLNDMKRIFSNLTKPVHQMGNNSSSSSSMSVRQGDININIQGIIDEKLIKVIRNEVVSGVKAENTNTLNRARVGV